MLTIDLQYNQSFSAVKKKMIKGYTKFLENPQIQVTKKSNSINERIHTAVVLMEAVEVS